MPETPTPLSKEEREQLARDWAPADEVAGRVDIERYEATVNALEAEIGECEATLEMQRGAMASVVDSSNAHEARAAEAERRLGEARADFDSVERFTRRQMPKVANFAAEASQRIRTTPPATTSKTETVAPATDTEEELSKCPECGGSITRKDADWAECKACGHDDYPISARAAGMECEHGNPIDLAAQDYECVGCLMEARATPPQGKE